MSDTPALMKKAKWLTLTPYQQGYVWYMQAELPGSELHQLANPYAADTHQYIDFMRGGQQAVTDVLDGDDE